MNPNLSGDGEIGLRNSSINSGQLVEQTADNLHGQFTNNLSCHQQKMNLFKDEEDLQETIDFWKLHKTF